MGMQNAKSVKKLIAELRKQLEREPTMAEVRDAMQGRMPRKE